MMDIRKMLSAGIQMLVLILPHYSTPDKLLQVGALFWLGKVLARRVLELTRRPSRGTVQ